MKSTDIKGPNGLATYLLEGLSEDTLWSMYKDYRTAGKIGSDLEREERPESLIESYVCEVFYTAGYNLVLSITPNDSDFDRILNE